MNNSLFFLIIAITNVCFTIVTLFNGPIINKKVGSDWNIGNCQKFSDEYELAEKQGDSSKEEKRKLLNECSRKKAMYGMEYTSLNVDIVFGFICALLGLLTYFDISKGSKKIIGIIGLVSGIICFILTLVYIIYSAYIFSNDHSNLRIIDANGIFAEWDEQKDKFVCKNVESKDLDEKYVKYKDLGKKQYNYDKDNYFINEGEKLDCSIEKVSDPTFTPEDLCDGNVNVVFSRPSYDNEEKLCDYLYYTKTENTTNKYLYDIWTTSIIFGSFVMVLNLGLGVFGFLLFKEEN